MLTKFGGGTSGAWIDVGGVRYFFQLGQKILIATVGTTTVTLGGRDIGVRVYGAAGGGGGSALAPGGGGGGGASHSAGLAVTLQLAKTYAAIVGAGGFAGNDGQNTRFQNTTDSTTLLWLQPGTAGQGGAFSGSGGTVLVGAGGLNGGGGSGSSGAGGGNGGAAGAGGGGVGNTGGTSSGQGGGSGGGGNGGGGAGGGGAVFGVGAAAGYGGGGGGPGDGGGGGQGGNGAIVIEFVL